MTLPRRTPLRVPRARKLAERLKDGALRLWAPAKINLNLLVGARRTDGYHELDSYVAKVTLYDRLVLRPRPGRQITLSCRGDDCGPDEDNLALRAAMALRERCAASGLGRVENLGARIEMAKRIPPGKGLGGGSSDAAAVLSGLNELWRLGLGHDELAHLGQTLGSDVPLFLGPTALRMRGRGQIVQPVQIAPFVALLILSEFHCSTSLVYRALDQQSRGTGAGHAKGISERQLAPEVFASPPSAWRGRLVNDLQPPAFCVCRELGQLRDEIASAIALPVHMTGSGSALFVLCDDSRELAGVANALPPHIRPLCLAVRSLA